MLHLRQRSAISRPSLLPLEDRWLPSVYLEIEPNNTAATANTVIVPTGDFATASPDDELTIEAALATNADRDFFRFSLTQSAVVFLDIDSKEISLSSSLNSTLDVYDSTGLTLVASNNQGYDFRNFVPPITPVNDAASDDPALAVNLAAGEYVVRVSSFLNTSAGKYHLRLLADPMTSPAPPAFSSRPSATRTLFLDFDGHAATDDWGTYSAAAFDLDGQPAVFSAGERWSIYRQWQIVAEDFVALDINVTTVDPGAFDNAVSYRMVTTNSSPAIVNRPTSSRGAAVTGSFTGAGVNTGFVFANTIGDYLCGISGRIIAGALERGNECSRQFGIAVGLRNYGALNSQPIGIMQTPDAGLSRATWSAGWTHSGESPIVFQDDMDALTAIGGIPLLADDVGDTFSTATEMTGATFAGMIRHRTLDRDMLRLHVQQGFQTVRLEVDPWAGNLDTELRIFNSAGEFLVQSDQVNSFGNVVSFYIAAAGDCFIEVRSDGDPGEIGSYQLRHSSTPVTDPVRVNSFVINDGHIQRSMVERLEVLFSRPIQFPNGIAPAVLLQGPSGPVDAVIDLSEWTPSETPIILRFPNGTGGFGSLPNGLYEFRLVSNSIIDDAGNFLDGDADGQSGGDFVVPFHRLRGDLNGDRSVTSLDYAVFRTVYGQSGTMGLFIGADLNQDGIVSGLDFSLFRVSYGSVI